ncbi:tyrosine-protein phosphatase [Treponema sp.]|uniref:tyrosine-protein phosphatase n=1 Tax=Treponema sp. TaxID=166 RepID=UPI00298E588D|nr:tyrosine-protein phosphatase [Treponema sp.]MCR5613460.1 tyrosine-protein phosphatase [Treponema sp.]
MKSLKNTFICLFLLLLLGGFVCAAEKASFQAEISEIDVHGNSYLSIKPSLLITKGFSASDIVNVQVGTYKFTAPIVRNYSDVDNGEFLLRLEPNAVSLSINMGNFAKVTGAEVGTKVTVTLKKSYGYLIEFQTRMLKQNDDRTRFASDEIFANFREVSGGKIAKGKLYRSYSPIRGDNRSPYAAKLVESTKIDLVINLGDSKESAEPQLKSVPYYKSLSDNGKVLYVNMGSSFSGDEFNAQLKEALVFIAEHPDCKYLVHGKDGKNRTGFIAGILLALNGATLEEITEDYMKSFENLYSVQKNFQQYDLISNTVPFMFSNINGGKKVTQKNLHQVVTNYLINTIGLTKAQVDALCKNLQ